MSARRALASTSVRAISIAWRRGGGVTEDERVRIRLRGGGAHGDAAQLREEGAQAVGHERQAEVALELEQRGLHVVEEVVAVLLLVLLAGVELRLVGLERLGVPVVDD